MTKHTAATNIHEMSLDDLRARAEKARGHLAQIAELLPGLVHLSTEDRLHSNGRFQAGEVPAMKKLLVAAGKHPALFTALADKDGGKDAETFEPQPAIDDLDRITALQDLAADAESFVEQINDTLLAFGADARAIGVPVYAILQANKSVDPKLASDAAEGVEFYAARGRAVARARAKKKTPMSP
jgi:hypothetical protein